ncbi:MAG: hypothetical protein O3B90_13480 [Actinomycetota bacterium]|nr:hypothetical protein [Actinomycetota bacterium]
MEVKTGTAFTMYSNLHAADGTTNHLLVRSTLSVGKGPGETWEILETNHAALVGYVDSEYAITTERLFNFLSYADAGVQVRVRSTQTNAEQNLNGGDNNSSLSVMSDKFQLVRPVDQQTPRRCQRSWLPLG